METTKFRDLVVCFVVVNVAMLVSLMGFNYYGNSENKAVLNTQNELSNETLGSIENNFHIFSVANSKTIKVSYEPINKENVAWPVKIYYKVYEDNNIIKQGSYNYVYTKNQQPISINIDRKKDKKYRITSEIKDKNSKIVNKSSLSIHSLDSIKGDFQEPQKATKQTLSFDQEIDYIQNNINDLVSSFQEQPNSGDWYVVDIRLVKSSDKIAESKDGVSETYTDVIVIFEDGHSSYLVKLEKTQDGYEVLGYYNFIQRPNQKVGWKEIGTDNYLEVGEVIYHWDIEQ